MRKDIVSRARLPLAIAIVCVAGLVGAYWFYVHRQTAYFSKRDMRLLARTSTQLQLSLAQTRGYVRNYARWQSPQEWPSHRHDHDTETHEKIAELYFPGFEWLERSLGGTAPVIDHTAPTENDQFKVSLAPGSTEPYLHIEYKGLRPASITVRAPGQAEPSSASAPTRVTAAQASPDAGHSAEVTGGVGAVGRSYRGRPWRRCEVLSSSH